MTRVLELFRTNQYSVAQIFELDIIFFVYIEIFQLMRGHSTRTFNAEHDKRKKKADTRNRF